jgi:hypothetical protein
MSALSWQLDLSHAISLLQRWEQFQNHHNRQPILVEGVLSARAPEYVAECQVLVEAWIAKFL